jgi:hypothetical protein
MNTVLARLLPGHADGDAAAVRLQKEQREQQKAQKEQQEQKEQREQQKEQRDAAQVTFPDLVWDHFHWEQQRRDGTTGHPDAARRYRKTRAAFETRYGEIIGEYWSIVEPSGVALTHKKVPLLFRPIIDDNRHFHRSTDWVTRHNPALADVLFHCENLAIRITEVLRYTPESVGLKRIMAVASHVLGVIDRDQGVVAEAKAGDIAAKENAELGDIRDYYRRAGKRIGLTVYTQGMIMGVLIVAALLALGVVALSLWSSITWDRYDTRIVVSIAAGALGAFVSVLQRISSSDKTKFTVHYDLGKRTLYMLGSYRPVLGAVFGVFTYFVLASGIVQTKTLQDTRTALYYYGSLAFVAGFSERFTQVLAKSVEGLVPAQGTNDESGGGAADDGGQGSPPQLYEEWHAKFVRGLCEEIARTGAKSSPSPPPGHE